MDRLFFDTNVLLDVLEERAPWFPESAINWQASHLITRNTKDFPSEHPLVIISPADYLEMREN